MGGGAKRPPPSTEKTVEMSDLQSVKARRVICVQDLQENVQKVKIQLACFPWTISMAKWDKKNYTICPLYTLKGWKDLLFLLWQEYWIEKIQVESKPLFYYIIPDLDCKQWLLKAIIMYMTVILTTMTMMTRRRR